MKSQTVDIKSVVTEYPKTSHKLSKTIKQAEKIGSNSSLCSSYEINSLKSYGLCPKLKMTKVELELIPGPDMCIYFERGERGGISHISNR